MGHIVNPISIRLGLIRFWQYNTVPSYIKNYPYLHDYYYRLNMFLEWFFDSKFFESNAIILANSMVFNTHKKIHIILYVLNIKTYDDYRELSTKITNVFFPQYFRNANNFDESTQLRLQKFCNLYIKCLFNLVESSISISLKKILNDYLVKFHNKSTNIVNNHNLELTFYNATPDNLNYNAAIIANFIKIRLSQKYRLLEVIKPVITHLNSLENLDGFKISCSGRFTRKELATYSWFKKKRVPLNTIEQPIDYYYKKIVLKYGTCGIKVWLTHKNIEKYAMNQI